MLFKATLIGAALLAAACATHPASARPIRTGHHFKTASIHHGHPAGIAPIRVNHSNASQASRIRWPVHFDDQFVLDP